MFSQNLEVSGNEPKDILVWRQQLAHNNRVATRNFGKLRLVTKLHVLKLLF